MRRRIASVLPLAATPPLSMLGGPPTNYKVPSSSNGERVARADFGGDGKPVTVSFIQFTLGDRPGNYKFFTGAKRNFINPYMKSLNNRFCNRLIAVP